MPTLTPAQIQALYKMPPGEASAYVAGRATMQVTYDWAQMRGAEHANAFTVSRLARADILDALYRNIQKSVDGDLSRRDWVRDAKTLLKKEGWWGEITVPVGAQGDTVVTKFDSARLGLIFDTNTTTANNAGRWARFEKTKASHPYLRYLTRSDGRVREQHAQWHNLTLPVDHAFWNTHAPQNGWRCRCVLIAERAKNVEGNPDLITTAPPIEYVAWNNKFTGQTEQIPKGIDPGWAYNVGNAGAREAALKAQEQTKLGQWSEPVAQQYKADNVEPLASVKKSVQESFSAPDAAEFFMGKVHAQRPIAELPQDVKELLGSKTDEILLSSQTAEKQAREHPEIKPEDYLRLQSMLETGEVLRDRDLHISIIENQGNWYYAVIKVTKSGETNYLKSLRITNIDDIERIRKRSELLRAAK